MYYALCKAYFSLQKITIMNEQKKVIITGASGGLGVVVTEAFLKEGWKVIAFVSSEQSAGSLPANENLEIHVADLAD